jgi:hypothetical protein
MLFADKFVVPIPTGELYPILTGPVEIDLDVKNII